MLLRVSLLDAQLSQSRNSQDSDREPWLGSPSHFSIPPHLRFIKPSLGNRSRMTPAAAQGKAKLSHQCTWLDNANSLGYTVRKYILLSSNK